MSSVTYITIDSVLEGVGASQVWPYVARLPEYGHQVRLTSFEHDKPHRSPDPVAGVQWTPEDFGVGRLAAVRRVATASRIARASHDSVVHARSDLPALAAMLARHPRWIWDMRAFWREQRIYLGALVPGSASERLMRVVESEAAARATAIVCLAHSAQDVLSSRFGSAVASKAVVIPTAVDTTVFAPMRRGSHRAVRLLMSGSYNRFYDGRVTARFVEAMRRRQATSISWVGANESSPWWATLKHLLDEAISAVPFESLPSHIRRSDAGVAICQFDGGVALRGAMPTKIAEFLSCGRPVIVNRGLGDMDALLSKYECGVVLDGPDDQAIERGADELLELLADPAHSDRARMCAEEHFDLESSVSALAALYVSTSGSRNSPG